MAEVKEKILIGQIVRVLRRINGNKVEVEGMVVYKKHNNRIGINFGHYNLIRQRTDLTNEGKRKLIVSLGSDDIFSKEEITKIVEKW